MNLLAVFLLFAALAVYVFARPVDIRFKRDSPPGPPDHPPPHPPAEADAKTLIAKRGSVPDPGPKAKRDIPPELPVLPLPHPPPGPPVPPVPPLPHP
ncbi:unnamed protein product [Caenorhabditis nigoni]